MDEAEFNKRLQELAEADVMAFYSKNKELMDALGCKE